MPLSYNYPHHPHPNEAVNKMQKMMVATRYLSSKAIIFLLKKVNY